MPDAVSIDGLHGRILRDTFQVSPSELEGLLLFSIFHTYQIELSGPVLNGRCAAVTLVSADTQRGCAAAVSELYTGHRAEPMYWYDLWGTWGSYGKLASLTEVERARMRDLMRRIQGHPFVKGFAFDDPGHDPAGYFNPGADHFE